MKKRCAVGLAVFILLAAFAVPQAAADIHFFFIQEWNSLIWTPLEGWKILLHGGKPMYFYLLLCGILAIALLGILLTGSSLNYRSGSWVVTPDIITPCADGQGQFGSARWLQANQIHRYFGIWKITKNAAFQALLDAGKADREEIQNANIKTG